MGLNEGSLVRDLKNYDTYDDIVRFKKANKHHDKELFQYTRMMDEDDNADANYKEFFSAILSNEESKKKRNKKDDDVGENEDNDPQYELVLKCLKEYGNSYLLEGEKDGKTVVARYEEDTNSDNEQDLELRRKISANIKHKHDPISATSVKKTEIKATERKSIEQSKKVVKEYKNSYLLEGEKDGKTVAAKYEEARNSNNDFEPARKLRSHKKRGNEFSNNITGEELIKDKHDASSTASVKKTEINAAQRIPMEQSKKVVKVENVENSSDVSELDSDYGLFFGDFKIEDGRGVYKHKEHMIVYWTADACDDLEKMKDDDEIDEGSSDDVEILYIKKGNVNPFKINMDNLRSTVTVAEFRQLLINVNRNPYDREEYNRLLEDFKTCKPELRHKDLRGGREVSCPTGQEGKSYHDRYQDLAEWLFLYKNDEPRSLNLLRGFFFWLQNVSHDGAFKPWQDKECRSLIPRSF